MSGSAETNEGIIDGLVDDVEKGVDDVGNGVKDITGESGNMSESTTNTSTTEATR